MLSKPVAFDPYGRRRGRRVPSWLVLLVGGIVVGAAGVVIVQERYLPPRLSAAASTQLQAAFSQADAERQRLQGELGATAQRLEAALADKKALAEQLSASRETAERLRADVASLIESLPPDPRGGSVQVRAARFRTDGAKLLYDVVLSREQAAGKAWSGVVQLLVTGTSKRGPETTVKLDPVAVTLRGFESLRGGATLPEGFDARQATIHVLDRPEGKLMGMRVMLVK